MNLSWNSSAASSHPALLSERRKVLFNDLYDNFMILLHRQPTDHDNAHDPLDVLNPDREPAAMYRVLPRPLPEHELSPERILVPRELVVQEPRARMPAQDRRPLARDPGVVVGGRAARRRAVEQELRVRGERDVHDGGARRRALQAGAQTGAELPSGVGCKVWEDAALLLRCDRFELGSISVQRGAT